MYDVIADFLRQQFPACKTVINKITFDLLKGWKIDVAAILQNRNNYVVSVEAKNDVSPESILQGISQAEMYQRASNEAYVALPLDDVEHFKRTKRDDWNRVVDFCKLKGVGVIGVCEGWQDCKVLLEAMRIDRFTDLRDNILNNLELETLASFEGFGETDFDYFTGRAKNRKEIVRRKIELLVEEIKHYILANPREYPEINTQKLVAELPPRGLQKDFCWFFIAETEKRKISSSIHFTFTIENSGISCILTIAQTNPRAKLFIEKLNSDTETFLGVLKEIGHANRDYVLDIHEQIPEPKKRRPDWPWFKVLSVENSHLNKDVVKALTAKLSEVKYPVIRLISPPIEREKAVLLKGDIIKKCAEPIRIMQRAYGYFR